jgi:hypothetical protein
MNAKADPISGSALDKVLYCKIEESSYLLHLNPTLLLQTFNGSKAGPGCIDDGIKGYQWFSALFYSADQFMKLVLVTFV